MHNIEYFTYPHNVDKAKVQKRLDDFVAHEDWQEGCTGLYRDIRWIENKVYSSEEEAHKALETLDRGNYDQLAVPFTHSIRKEDAKLKELENKLADAYKEMDRRRSLLYSATVKAAFIGCKKCGSKLARTFLRSNSCPVCHSDLRPEHMIASCLAAEKKWTKANTDITSHIQKHGKKETLWMVKIEYHT